MKIISAGLNFKRSDVLSPDRDMNKAIVRRLACKTEIYRSEQNWTGWFPTVTKSHRSYITELMEVENRGDSFFSLVI